MYNYIIKSLLYPTFIKLIVIRKFDFFTFFIKIAEKKMKLRAFQVTKTSLLHTNVPPSNQNTFTKKSVKIMERGGGGGGGPVTFLLNASNTGKCGQFEIYYQKSKDPSRQIWRLGDKHKNSQSPYMATGLCVILHLKDDFSKCPCPPPLTRFSEYAPLPPKRSDFHEFLLIRTYNVTIFFKIGVTLDFLCTKLSLADGLFSNKANYVLFLVFTKIIQNPVDDFFRHLSHCSIFFVNKKTIR